MPVHRVCGAGSASNIRDGVVSDIQFILHPMNMLPMPPTHVLFFSHERVTFDAVHDLNVRSKSRHRLQGLLLSAASVVQRQTATLDGVERADIGSFEDLVELTERHATRPRGSIVVDLVLLTTAQVGKLLVYVNIPMTICVYCHLRWAV
jgi:hypothetical protein